MKAKVSLKQIGYFRWMILEGYTVKEIGEKTGISENTIRLYTKAERAKVKLDNKMKKEVRKEVTV